MQWQTSCARCSLADEQPAGDVVCAAGASIILADETAVLKAPETAAIDSSTLHASLKPKYVLPPCSRSHFERGDMSSHVHGLALWYEDLG